MKHHVLFPILVAATMVLHTAPADAQNIVTFVSGNGNDTSANCTELAPCRTLSNAHGKTADGGQISCLDAANYGQLFVTKSITIDCASTTATVQVGGAVHITVNGANIVVNLRNITLGGLNHPFNGDIGIHFISGAMLNLHNVNIHGMTTTTATGIYFTPNTGNSTLLVTNSAITGNGIIPSAGGGIAIQPAMGGSARVTIENSKIAFNSNGLAANSNSGPITLAVRDSTIASNRTGIVTAGANPINMAIERTSINNSIGTGLFAASASSTIRLSNSLVTGNGTGIATAAGGVVRSFNNNVIEGNGTDGVPTQQTNLK